MLYFVKEKFNYNFITFIIKLFPPKISIEHLNYELFHACYLYHSEWTIKNNKYYLNTFLHFR